MNRFRLSAATMAIPLRNDSKLEPVIVPAGSEVVSIDPIRDSPGLDGPSFITVEWNGVAVSMSQRDLIERGDRLD
jgi:hypothetical protein